MRVCSYKDCVRRHFGNGFCNAHYKQVRKYGVISDIDRRTLDKIPVELDLRKSIIKDYIDMVGMNDLTKKYAMGKSTIYSVLRREGVKIRGKGESKLGTRNPNWNENPSYSAVHAWVRTRKPKPSGCGYCGKVDKLDLANVSKSYNPTTYIRDITMWNWLCRRCHMTEDGRLTRLPHKGKLILYAKCTYHNCLRAHEAKGLCTKHYQAYRRGKLSDYLYL